MRDLAQFLGGLKAMAPMFLGPRAIVEDPGRALHVWSFPLPGYDGGQTYAAIKRFEALYYGEPSINPFFEACDVSACPICQHSAARAHRAYLSSFDLADSLKSIDWFESVKLWP